MRNLIQFYIVQELFELKIMMFQETVCFMQIGS